MTEREKQAEVDNLIAVLKQEGMLGTVDEEFELHQFQGLAYDPSRYPHFIELEINHG